jgi:hypothetical protein
MLIEQHEASLDSSVDLSDYGQDVEGMTAFYPDRNAEVSISDRLANDPRRENRLRRRCQANSGTWNCDHDGSE